MRISDWSSDVCSSDLPLMLEAAAQGIGVAFMHGQHFDDAHDPRLVRLFDFDVDIPYSYWFVCRPRSLRPPAVKLFPDLLLSARICRAVRIEWWETGQLARHELSTSSSIGKTPCR